MDPRFYSLPKEKQEAILNVDAMEKDFRKLLEFWKKVYLRKDREGTRDDGKDI